MLDNHLPTEASELLPPSQEEEEDAASQASRMRQEVWGRWSYFAIWAIVAYFVLSAIFVVQRHRRREGQAGPFPDDFVWGVATSSFQIEGATKEDGRGPSIWDTFCENPGAISDHSNADIACDHYHRMEQDVRLMKEEIGVRAYRFSIAWPRIQPDATKEVNQQGIDFYNRLINTLLGNDIEPWVTLYHWDLPQWIEDEHNGWLGNEIVELFGEYARICFEAFGDRVHHWITINESWTVAVNGYNNGIHAPGRSKNSAYEPYVVGHHLILAHARAAQIYRTEFADQQGGQIGVSHSGDYRYPQSASLRDKRAAERAMLFQFGWFADPIFHGDYPKEMRSRLGERLPRFTKEERDEVVGSVDFLGLNHYSSLLASEPEKVPEYGGYWADIFVNFTSRKEWKQNDMGWSIVPSGARDMLLWITDRYNATIVMTENGSAEYEPDLATGLEDHARKDYFERYIHACGKDIDKGVDLRGYFAWSLMDNFEWQFGYTKRFGMCYVDYATLERTPKLSAKWYQQTIAVNGQNLYHTREEKE